MREERYYSCRRGMGRQSARTASTELAAKVQERVAALV